MRKLLLILLVMLSAMADAQKLTKTEVLKSLEFGVIKLQRSVQQGDTIYMLNLADLSTSRSDRVIVGLGDRQNAIRLLGVLAELQLGKDDVLEWENPTNNYVKKNGLGGFYILHELGVRYGRIGRGNVKTFIKILQGTPAKEKPSGEHQGNFD